MPGPLVSIVVPVHDAAATIGETIASIRAQTYDHWELLLVDDGSTDDGISVATAACHDMAQPLTVLGTGVAGGAGPAKARNLGLEAAGGELLALLDADDAWEPAYLAMRVEALTADAELGLVFGPSLYWHPDGGQPDYVQPTPITEPRRRFEPGEVIPYWLSMLRATPCPGSTVTRTALARAAGGYPDELRRGEDIAFCMRVAMAHPTLWDGRVAHRYRRHANSATRTANATGRIAEHDLAFARWAARFVAAQPSLRCSATAADNLRQAAADAAAAQPHGRRRASLARTLLSEPSFAPYRWSLLPLLALPDELGRRVAGGALARLGAGTPSRQVPEQHAYRGVTIRAAANTHDLAARLAATTGLGPHTHALDLGAGEGALSRRLLDLGVGHLHACEREEGRFRVAGVGCSSVDLDQDFADEVPGPFDLVVAVEIIEHLETPRLFLRRIADVLAPGGHLVLSSPNVASWYSRLQFLRSGDLHWFNPDRYHRDGHIHPLFDWQVHEFGRDAGLEVVASETTVDDLLRIERLRNGDASASLRGWLNRGVLHYALLRPLMRGAANGEGAVWLLRKLPADPGPTDRA